MKKDTNNSSDSLANYKKPIERSVAYPAYTIEYCVEFTQTIYKNFGLSGFNTREAIAAVLKKSPDYLKSQISACVQYGLLEMKSKLGYKPSQLFMKLYKQDDPLIIREVLLTCLKEPKLYAGLIEKYKNDVVPHLAGLANYLFRNGIVENVAEKAATVFLDNLKALNLISADNKLLDENELNHETIDETDTTLNKNLEEVSVVDISNTKDLVSNDTFIVEVPLIDNRKAKIICPIDVNNRDWKKIVKILSSYLDEEDE